MEWRDDMNYALKTKYLPAGNFLAGLQTLFQYYAPTVFLFVHDFFICLLSTEHSQE